MTNNYSAFRLLALSLMLFFAHTLPAQWIAAPAPGNESVSNIFSVGNAWVAFTESGCYRSANDGLSWSKTLALEGYQSVVNDSGTDIYAISLGVGLYKSSDEGQTWGLLSAQTQGGNAYPDGIAVTDHYILYETHNAVYRYDKANPAAPSTALEFAALYYPNTLLMQAKGNEIWVAVKDSLLRSADEGSTWSLVHEGLRAQGFELNGDTLMLSTASGVHRSVDNGVTWTLVFPANSAYAIFWESGQWFVDAYAGNGFSLQSSEDGGATWHPFSPLLDNASVYKVARHGGTTLAAGSAGIVRSTDGGAYWEFCNTGLANDNFSSFGGRISTLGAYLALNNQFSEDDGATWFQPLTDANYLGYPLSEHNGSFFGIDYDRKLYRSVGDLRHWQPIGVQFPAGLSEKLITTDNHFYRLEYDGWNGGNAIIYESADNGLSWVPTGGTSGANPVPHGDYLFEWRGFLGLFRSQNAGVSWQSVGAGLGELAQGSGDATVYSDGSHLFVYDYNAIMVSSNNGLTFTKISNHLLGNSGFPMGADYLASDGTMIVVLTYEGVFLSQGLSDQWFDISANLPYTDFYDETLIVHNGYILLDYGWNDTPLWKRAIASINLAQFDGKVWRDDNNNGQEDPGELPYPGAIVQAGTGSFATSGLDGGYQLFADLNNDTLRVKKPAPWVIANPEFYQLTASASGKNFGLYFPPNIIDLQVDLTNQTVFRPGFNENIYLSYANVGTANADGTLRFVPNPPLEFQSAFPAPDGISGDTLFWNLQNIPAFFEGQIIVSVKVPVGTPLGSEVTAFASISPTQTDANPVDNQSYLEERVFGSYDPNDKRCNTPSITPEQITAGEALTYTIRFQNTGTYPAEFVRIADTLDFERLDVATFQVLAASHLCQTILRGNGAVEFFFDQIDLPPSDFNEPASHGFVKYSIRPKAGLALGQQIHNTAYIYFDFNSAIVTNTTETSVAETVGTHEFVLEVSNQEALILAPNPSRGIVLVETKEKTPGTLRVFNALGTMVLERTDFSDLEKLDLRFLSAGYYSIEWRSENGLRKMGKLVKINY